MPQISEWHERACLESLLADPIIQAVMKADRVDPAEFRRMVQRTLAKAAHSLGSGTGELSLEPDRDPAYRPGVGIVLFNDSGNILVGRRADAGGQPWQMPQGGIEPGESPLAAALRELREEIGTDNVAVLAESKGWLRYDVPVALAGRAWNGRWRGQQQKWFAMRFLGTSAEIDVATEHPEFNAWRWVSLDRAAELIITFKESVYREVLEQFRQLDLALPEVSGRE